jgi:hypothetical protein
MHKKKKKRMIKTTNFGNLRPMSKYTKIKAIYNKNKHILNVKKELISVKRPVPPKNSSNITHVNITESNFDFSVLKSAIFI